MNTPTGFLVVRSGNIEQDDEGRSSRPYMGVGRVPAYPSDDPEEEDALAQYVFGDYKDEETNLIPTYDRALLLYQALSASWREYNILFVGEGPDALSAFADAGLSFEHLGYDVAAVTADYWSIVEDLSPSAWAKPFSSDLNEYGLFRRRGDAETYLREYRIRGEPDGDSPFDILFVARVVTEAVRRG